MAGRIGIESGRTFAAQDDAGPDASGAMASRRQVSLLEASGFVDCPIYDRISLLSGSLFARPAVVEQVDVTTIVPPGSTALIEPYLNLILEAV